MQQGRLVVTVASAALATALAVVDLARATFPGRNALTAQSGAFLGESRMSAA